MATLSMIPCREVGVYTPPPYSPINRFAGKHISFSICFFPYSLLAQFVEVLSSDDISKHLKGVQSSVFYRFCVFVFSSVEVFSVVLCPSLL